MRARPLTALAAIAAVTLVLAGCDEAMLEAKVQAKRPDAGGQHSPLPGAPDRSRSSSAAAGHRRRRPGCRRGTPPSAGFGGLQTRIQQATDEAAASGATLSVAILDRKTHELVSNGNTQIIGTASVAKLFIADDLLLQESQGKTTLSPERPPGIGRHVAVVRRRRRREVLGSGRRRQHHQRRWRADTGWRPPPRLSDGRWWNTMSSLTDLIHYYDMLLDGAGGLPRGAGQDHRQRPGPIHPERNRRLPAAVRHPRRLVRRTGGGQAGLDVLYRHRLDASVHRRDRRGPPLHHGGRVAAVLR